MLLHRKSLVSAGVLLLGGLLAGWIALQPLRADDDRKEPPKKTDASEEKNLKDALEHLRQFGDLVQKLKEAESRAKCAENLKQLGIAVHQFNDLKRPAPPANWQAHPNLQFQGQPGAMMWQILPYIEQDNLYSQLSGNRLGATTEPASPALATQLGIDDRGQVIVDVSRGGAAAKAGLQKHDVLVELAGKPVPRNAEEFQKTLHAIKPDAVVSAVVLRKGEKVSIKDLKLAAAQTWWGGYNAVLGDGAVRYFRTIPDGTSNTILLGEKSVRPNDWLGSVEPLSVNPLVTTHRKDDRFTARYQEGSLIITVTGTAKEGKHALGRVKVQDGGVEKVYESLEKVPPEYRDKASDVLGTAEKGGGRIDIKK